MSLQSLSPRAGSSCATVILSPRATPRQASVAKGLLGSVDHVEEAILILLLLVDL